MNDTVQGQLAATTTTGQLAAITATAPAWYNSNFGLGTSTGAEEEQEDNYDTNIYLKTHDGKWYSIEEMNEAIWEKFKDVYDWKHMRGSTANAIGNDVLEIIDGLKNGDLTIDGGLLYTVKNSPHFADYLNWKSKYEGNKPHHANSKYDQYAKNNAAWVVMNAFRTLTDEGTKKRKLQESASTGNLTALLREIQSDMLYNLGISNINNLDSWYEMDSLDTNTYTRGRTKRLGTILKEIDRIGTEYGGQNLKKEYGLTNRDVNRFKEVLHEACSALMDNTLDEGDLNKLEKLNMFLGMDLDWKKLLETNFETDEYKRKKEEEEAAAAEARKKVEEEARAQAYQAYVNNLYPGTVVSSTLKQHANGEFPTSVDNAKIKNYSDDTVKEILKAAIQNDTANNDYEKFLEMYKSDSNSALYNILHLAKNRNLLKSADNSNSKYYVPFLGRSNRIYVVDFSNRDQVKSGWVRVTDIPALQQAIQKTYENSPDEMNWDEFKKAADLTL